jgi:hypothetical protein
MCAGSRGGVLIAWASERVAFLARATSATRIVTFVYATQVPAMLDAFAIGIAIARLHVDGTMQRWTARSVSSAAGRGGAFAVALYFVWDSYWAHAITGQAAPWSSSGARASP